jgi:hypothetical protein
MGMEFLDTLKQSFGSTPFTASDLIAQLEVHELPVLVWRKIERQEGNPIKSLGRILANTDGIARVGTTRRHAALWQVKP